MEEATHRPPLGNIALLPPPAFLGHLIPFIELAKKLVFHHNCTVTLIIPDDGSSDMKPQRSLLKGIPAQINPVFLPPILPTHDLSQKVNPEILLPIRLIRSLPSLRHTLSSLQDSGTPASALVVDFFSSYGVDVAREFGIPAYVFYVGSANNLLLSLDLPFKPEESWTEDNSPTVLRPIKLSGSIVLNPEDFKDSMKNRQGEVYKQMLCLYNKCLASDGILVNSFLGLESEAFDELGQRRDRIPPVYPVGPLIRTESSSSSTDDDHDYYCLKWLNDQPPKSVLFVSFGSGAALSTEQFTELALGLEMSGHRFLWVVRSPQQNVRASYLLNNMNNIQSKVDPLGFLPQGFLERTKERGLVVASWAPQVRVLSHGSTGGFVTHCGWNSILEGVACDVPMIAWPLCFEQRMSAVILTQGVKGAIRVGENENGVVERGCVSQVVKQLMEGEQGKKIRNRIMDVKFAAAKVLSQEGSSAQALAQVVQNWTRGS